MSNEYLPIRAVIEKIVVESPDARTFILRPQEKNSRILKYKPGQFMLLSLAGFGEAPFTFASSPGRDGRFQISARKVGFLTEALHKLKEKDAVGVRGPFGNTFPLDMIKGKDLLFVAGGCGIAPLRSLIQYVFSASAQGRCASGARGGSPPKADQPTAGAYGGKKRKDYGRVEIIYGCRTPKDMFYQNEIKSWQANPDSAVHLTVDEPDELWTGTCGVVCVLLPKIKVNPKTTMVFLCGPGMMIKFAIKDILNLGFKEKNIYASLERYMKCGIGKCGHCYIKGKYACIDGPNFSYAQMKELGIES